MGMAGMSQLIGTALLMVIYIAATIMGPYVGRELGRSQIDWFFQNPVRFCFCRQIC